MPDVSAASKAIAGAAPGDVFVLADGLVRDLQLHLNANGLADRPVVLRPRTPGGVLVTGRSCLTISGRHVVVSGLVFDQAWGHVVVAFSNASRCRLTDCAFIECGNPKSTFSHIVTLRGHSERNRVDHCYMQGNLSMGMGVRISEADRANTHNRFDHNYFKDIVRRCQNGQEAIQLGQGSCHTTALHAVAQENLFDNASGDCEIISNKSSHNTIRYNTFRNCAAMLVLRVGSHARVDGNFFFDNTGGVRVHDGYHTIVNNYIEGSRQTGIYMPTGAGAGRHDYYNTVSHCVVAHNTIVNAVRVGLHVGHPHTCAKATRREPVFDNVFCNNLVVGNQGVLIRDDGSRTSTWRGNVVWPTGKAELGYETRGIRCVNLCLARKGELYRLANAKSPAVNPPSPTSSGMDEGVLALEFDVDGQHRDARPDVGADEVSDEPVKRRPLRPQDVGPTWMRGDPSVIRRIASPKPIPIL